MENFSLFPTDWVDVVEMRTSLVHPTPGTARTLCTTAVARSVGRKPMALEWADIAEEKERRCHDHHNETDVAETFLCLQTLWA